MKEQALRLPCGSDWLPAIVHPGADLARRGVLIVVGGPQYRVGSHRQFVLLARFLAAAGVPVLRFDYRGMGDADGASRDFQAVADDLRAAVDGFSAHWPGLQEVVLWGLCDAAVACACYAATDARVAGLVLLNPWVRTESGQARAYLKHYYLRRLLDPALWRKLLGGQFAFGQALGSLAANVRQAQAGPVATDTDLPTQLYEGLRRFQGPVLLILSGNDLTAAEFRELTANAPHWQTLLKAARVTRYELAEADHTFARADWRNQVAEWTRDWLRAW